MRGGSQVVEREGVVVAASSNEIGSGEQSGDTTPYRVIDNIDDPEWSAWRIALIIASRWRVLVACVTVASLAGVVIYFAVPRIYEARAILAPAQADDPSGALGGLASRLGGIASLAGISIPNRDAEVDVALALLQSRGFIERFLSREKLLPVLYADAWDARAGRWNVAETDRPTLQRGYLRFVDDVLAVGRDRQSGLVTLTVRWKDPQQAATWVSALVAQLNSEMRLTAEQEAKKGVEYLEQALNKASSVELKQTIYGLMEAQVNKAMLASVRQNYIFRVVDPPHISDPDQFVSPNKVLFGLSAILLGLTFGVIYALVAALRIEWTKLGDAAAAPKTSSNTCT